MTTAAVTINNALVMRDHDLTWRWFDAFGAYVRKWFFDYRSVVSTTTAAGATVTQTNGTLVATASVSGGATTITLGGGDNDVLEVQSRTEPFRFASRWPAYFGAKFQLVDADQTDFHLGWTITDTDHAGGISDGIYFRLVDESAVLTLVLEQDSVETTVELATLADATDYTAELYYDGDYVHAYINGVLVTSVAATNANFCNDEDLCATIAVQAGEGSANNCQLYWLRALQVQEA